MGMEPQPVAMEVSPREGAAAPGAVNGEPAAGGPPKELAPLKVTLYELLIRQLQDDGFVGEAQSISQALHVEPNTRVEKDALLEAYGKSLKWAFGDEKAGEWTPIICSPVPPLGPQDRVLELDATALAGGGAAGGDPRGALAPAAGAGARPGEQAAAAAPAVRKVPEIRLLYTASHKQACRAVAFSVDGRSCATGCVDGSIKVLDCARMRACAACTDGPLGRMRVTDEELAKPIVRTLQDHVMSVTCLAFHPTNPTLFSGSLDKAVKIFDLTRPPGHKKAFSILQDVHPVRCISVHPCGDFLLVGTAHPAVRLYDLQMLSCFTTFHQAQHHSGGVNDIRCTSDGRVFATASADGCIQLWDAVSNRMLNRIPRAHNGNAVTSVRWSKGLRYLLSSGADGRHRLWDVRVGQELYSLGFGPRTAEFGTAVFAAGERYIASANSNARLADVSLFEAHTGSNVFMKLGMHQMPVRALEASPVDNTLITGCDDHNARYFAVEDRPS